VHDTGPLLQALVYFAAAALFVPIFQRIGLGSVLGYLVAGTAIGPWGLKLVTDPGAVSGVSELGIVLLMFLVGLELEPKRLWSLRRAIFGLGALQVAVTIAAGAGAAFAAGLAAAPALVVGMALAMSSTAISLQVLGERHLGATPAGRAAFAVSLFQDLAVIPLLLALSALAPQAGAHDAGFSGRQLLVALALIAGMVLAGRLALRPVLRWIAGTRMREIFIAFALFLIVGSALLTQLAGLSMALGAFVAGVLLAESEYRMELEVDIEPFKGLLLGLFFIAVGMSIDLGLIARSPWLVAGLALAAVVAKTIVLMALGRLFRLCREDGWVFAISLSQVGEFAFVLLSQASADRIVPAPVAALASAVVAVSMLATPLLFVAWERFVRPRYGTGRPQAADPIDERNPVIVAGMGRFGQIVARLLLGRQVPVTIIDHDPNQVELMRRFGFRAYYGDARRPDVLEAAGIAQARLLVLAMDDSDAVRDTAEHVRRTWPAVRLLARAYGRPEAVALARMDVPAVRETFGSALDAARQALTMLGEGAYAARQAAQHFRRHDEALFAAQLEAEGDDTRLIAAAEQGRRELARLLRRELPDAPDEDGSGGSPW